MAKLTALGTLLLVGLLGLGVAAYAKPDMAEWSEVKLPAAGRAGVVRLADAYERRRHHAGLPGGDGIN
jgi:hypothetical protein